MRIVADPNIPFVEQAFAQFGEVELIPGRLLKREQLSNCEVLLVRSTVKVNASLLDDKPVRFVGTSTSGFDHVDMAYLRDRGIAFAYAPGSNAISVGEYVTAALLKLEQRGVCALEGRAIGIVGCGHVGRAVLARMRALGLRCIVNDPPLARRTAEPIYRPLDEIFDCDIVTLHVPLETTGPDATRHLVNEAFLARMKPGAILINAARGEIVEPQALRNALDRGHLAACVLDVWANEPTIDPQMVARCAIATAHIAGHSYDGKVDGTRMLYDAYCAYASATPNWDPHALLLEDGRPGVTLDPDDPHALHRAVSAVYDIIADDRNLREIAAVPEAARGDFFDALRKNYRKRRSFAHARVRLTRPDSRLETTLHQLGFSFDA